MVLVIKKNKIQHIIPDLKLVYKEMGGINNIDIRNYGGSSQIEFLAVLS